MRSSKHSRSSIITNVRVARAFSKLLTQPISMPASDNPDHRLHDPALSSRPRFPTIVMPPAAAAPTIVLETRDDLVPGNQVYVSIQYNHSPGNPNADFTSSIAVARLDGLLRVDAKNEAEFPFAKKGELVCKLSIPYFDFDTVKIRQDIMSLCSILAERVYPTYDAAIAAAGPLSATFKKVQAEVARTGEKTGEKIGEGASKVPPDIQDVQQGDEVYALVPCREMSRSVSSVPVRCTVLEPANDQGICMIKADWDSVKSQHFILSTANYQSQTIFMCDTEMLYRSRAEAVHAADVRRRSRAQPPVPEELLSTYRLH